MASLCSLQFHTLSSQHSICINGVGFELRSQIALDYCEMKLNRQRRRRNYDRQLVLTACGGDSSISVDNQSSHLGKHVVKFRQAMAALPPLVVVVKRHSGASLLLGIFIATTFLVMAVRMYVARSLRDQQPGTVADLVRRGQLRSDRRGISKPLKYEDPFNNPLVKVRDGNSTVEMCGKVYSMAPVTLTEEQREIHQRRRSRAYQWKRPKVFLKEGDSIPPDVDPDTIRWIPANHPFATTASDIDEDLAQTNVYQKNGIPFRIRAEHEALQKKLETLQNEQKLNKLTIDPVNAKDFERAFKTQSNSQDQSEKTTHNAQMSDISKPSTLKSDQTADGDGNSAFSKDAPI